MKTSPGRLALTVSTLLLLAACTSPREITLSELIDRHTQARGGQEAIEAVQAIRLDLTIEEPTFKVDGRYIGERGGRMRIDVYSSGERVFSEGHDGSRGWQLPQGAAHGTLASEAGTAALSHGLEGPINIRGLHELEARGHRIELLPRESVDGIEYYVVRVTLRDGYESRYYIDPQSWLITRRRDRRALHPDVDPTPTEIEERYLDHRAFAGVQVPTRTTQTDLATGKPLQTVIVREVEINPKIASVIFEAP